MLTKDVYVVYQQKDDEILSVHSAIGYAKLNRRDRVNDDVNMLRSKGSISDDDINKIEMRYVVGTLEEALDWMRSPVSE